MRARPNLSAEQLVADYLTRVEQAARQLPKRARMAFVGRTRALVEREVGPPGSRTDPQHVTEVLTRLGTPEDLVTAEQTRMEQGWFKRLSEPGPDGTGGPPAGPRSASSPSAGFRSASAPDGAAPGAGSQSGAPRRLRSADSPDTGPHDTSRQGTGPLGPQLQASPQGAGAGGSGHTNPIDRLFGHVPGKRGADGTETFTASVGRLAREHVRETVAILLLGLGGLILPFPFWPIGAVAAMFSRLWDVKDKLLAFAGPLLVTLAISVLVALFVGGHGRNVIEIYFHAVHLGFGLLIRVGSVITAAYLAWRVSQGPRFKVPPWRHQRR